jgi:hypothetical protein
MEHTTEREIGHLFGLIGGVLILAGGLFALAFGVTDLVLGHLAAAAGSIGAAIVLFVVGALVVLFAHMADHDWKSRPFASGVVLVVLAIVGWAALGFGANILALLGGIFALLAGVLYLIEPTQHAVSAIATSG